MGEAFSSPRITGNMIHNKRRVSMRISYSKAVPFLRIFWIIVLICIAAILALWIYQDFTRIKVGFSALQTPPIIPTPIATSTPLPTLTPSAPIALPTDSLQPLTWDPDKQVLYNPKGEIVYTPYENRMWVPTTFSLESEGLDNPEITLHDDGSWLILDDQEHLMYQWDPKNLEWISASKLQINITLDEKDHWKVILPSFGTDLLRARSDIQILEAAPNLAPQDYGLEVSSLIPARVLHLPNSNEILEIFYADPENIIRAAWDLVSNTILVVSQASYKDPDSGIEVRMLLVNDPYYARYLWYSFINSEPAGTNDLSLSSIPHAVFDYPLAINNFYTNHSDEFYKLLRISKPDQEDIWKKLDQVSPNTMSQLHNQALLALRSDSKNLPEGQNLSILFGNNLPISMDPDSGLEIILLLKSSSNGLPEKNNSFFRKSFFWRYIGIQSGQLILEVSNNYNNLVGGSILAMLREMTAGGASGSRYEYLTTRQRPKTEHSTTDAMVLDVCGLERIELYWQQLPSEYQQKKVVPLIDELTNNQSNNKKFPSDCGLKENLLP
jgi:hypothetical protein